MKTTLLTLALIALVIPSALSKSNELPKGYTESQRTKIQINDQWRFKLGGADEKNYTTTLNDSSWEEVTIPHTLKLTSTNLDGCDDDKHQKTFHREVGWYRRTITPSANSTKRVVLEFEGVHQITTLWVNGRKVGVHRVGGYTPFEFDITKYVKRGAKNQITVLADNRVSLISPPDPGMFDYIKFSGLYRDLYLTEHAELHITSNLESLESGITITTPSVDYVNGNATIDIRTEVRNDSRKPQDATLIQRVVDASGEVVLKMEQTVTIAPGESHRFIQTGGIEDDVKFWSPDSPYLYKVNTLLVDKLGNPIDQKDNRLGLRKVEYNHERGFILNGKEIEIIGFNRHQHYAYIGDAMPNSLHYRDMIQFKNYGFNAMRTAHYPQDDEILRACDELGILVYEEAPTWVSISNEKEWFKNFQTAARTMIRNHRNSPSVIIWGSGINHRGAVPEVQFLIKQEDPTRLTASQSSRWTGWQTSSWTDIFANMNYGPGIWDRSEPLFGMEGRFGPEAIAPYFNDPMMPGMLSWTAHAYYTFHDFGKSDEKTRLGVMDAFRYPKEADLLWYPAEMLTAPYIYVVDKWEEGLKSLKIFSNATEIELIQDGRTTGRYTPSRSKIYNGLKAAPYIINNPKYVSSTLTIKGYREGREIFTKEIHTPEKASKLRLSVDQYDVDFVADGNDILIFHAEVVDANGTKLSDYEGNIKFTVSGDATVVGDGANIEANPVKVRLGKGSALIRAGKSAGDVTVTASAEGLTSSSLKVKSVEAERDMILAHAYPINDRETVLIDMGAEGQLAQFGWTRWIGTDGEQSSEISVLPAKLKDLVAGDTPATTDAAEVVAASTPNSYKFKVSTASGSGVMRWLGEMNVIGQNGFVYGDGVLCVDKKGLKLSMEQLPVGSYRLKCYHHAPMSNTNSMDPNLERLKTERINKIPFAELIDIDVNGHKTLRNVEVTSGRERQNTPVGISEVEFSVTPSSGGKAEVLFRSASKNDGVWLDGFELVREL